MKFQQVKKGDRFKSGDILVLSDSLRLCGKIITVEYSRSMIVMNKTMCENSGETYTFWQNWTFRKVPK